MVMESRRNWSWKLSVGVTYYLNSASLCSESGRGPWQRVAFVLWTRLVVGGTSDFDQTTLDRKGQEKRPHEEVFDQGSLLEERVHFRRQAAGLNGRRSLASPQNAFGCAGFECFHSSSTTHGEAKLGCEGQGRRRRWERLRGGSWMSNGDLKEEFFMAAYHPKLLYQCHRHDSLAGKLVRVES